ncbi:MAG: hypothetical protein ACKV22_33425 [Bryobacteraceae bacterium]
MTRRWMLALPVAGWVRGSDRPLMDLFADLAVALSEGEIGVFLSCFDRSMKGYSDLERDVTALVGQNNVSCSIEILREGDDGPRRQVELDCLLSIQSRSISRTSERRRVAAKCEVRRQGKKWRITSFDPLSLFAPPDGK